MVPGTQLVKVTKAVGDDVGAAVGATVGAKEALTPVERELIISAMTIVTQRTYIMPGARGLLILLVTLAVVVP
jgi:hypothetical protein